LRGTYYLHLQDFYLEDADGTFFDKCHNLEDHNMYNTQLLIYHLCLRIDILKQVHKFPSHWGLSV